MMDANGKPLLDENGDKIFTQVTCTLDANKKKIFDGLKLLHDIVKHANSIKTVEIENVMKRLIKIHNVGYIGAQHILTSLTLLRIIRNPMYVQQTLVLAKTGTEKNINFQGGSTFRTPRIWRSFSPRESVKQSLRMPRPSDV